MLSTVFDSGILLPILLIAVFGIIAVEAAYLPRDAWALAGYRRTLWLIYLVFLGGAMTIAYLIAVRPKLKAAQKAIEGV